MLTIHSSVCLHLDIFRFSHPLAVVYGLCFGTKVVFPDMPFVRGQMVVCSEVSGCGVCMGRIVGNGRLSPTGATVSGRCAPLMYCHSRLTIKKEEPPCCLFYETACLVCRHGMAARSFSPFRLHLRMRQGDDRAEEGSSA